MIQLHHEMHKTHLCRCRYFNDIINTRYICYVIHIYNTYFIKNNNMSSLFMGMTKKSIILDGTHTPPLKWHREHVHSTLYWIIDEKICIFCWIFILFNYKTQSHLMWRGLECNVLKSKPCIKSLIRLMSSGAPALLLIFPHTWTGRSEMGRKREKTWERMKVYGESVRYLCYSRAFWENWKAGL